MPGYRIPLAVLVTWVLLPGSPLAGQVHGFDDLGWMEDISLPRGLNPADFTPEDSRVQITRKPAEASRARLARCGLDVFLVYLPDAVEADGDPVALEIDLRQVEGKFHVQWHRLSDGTHRTGYPVYAGGRRGFTAPWRGGDAVLSLTRMEEGLLHRHQLKPHRGGAGEFPENTLHGFRQNLRDGTSLDMDVRRTADGQIVVIHDVTTGRTCDEDWVVTERTLAELQTLDAAYRFDPRGDRSYPLRGHGIRIPTLDEVLSLFGAERGEGAVAWIDTKDDETYPFEQNREMFRRLVEMIARHDLWTATLIEVGCVEQAELMRSVDPRIQLAYWAGNAPRTREALRYAPFAEIGVHLRYAAAVADDVRAAGMLLQVFHRRIGREEFRTARALSVDVLGTDHYRHLLEQFPVRGGNGGP
jgi:glycerophosphoryl diester phosphodiesterase